MTRSRAAYLQNGIKSNILSTPTWTGSVYLASLAALETGFPITFAPGLSFWIRAASMISRTYFAALYFSIPVVTLSIPTIRAPAFSRSRRGKCQTFQRTCCFIFGVRLTKQI